jgi:hypothetical protein
MEKKNKEIREIVIDYKTDTSLDINPLSMKINGIVDAAVNGKLKLLSYFFKHVQIIIVI